MARSGLAALTDAPKHAPEPYPIGLLRRFTVRRMGRLDGRRGIPDPTVSPSPVSTQARKNMESDFVEVAHGLWVRYLESIEGHRRELQSLQHQLPALREAVMTARRELEQAQAARPNVNALLRRMGELDQPVELVRIRRVREHERAVTVLRRQYEQAQRALEAGEQREAFLESDMVSRRELAVAHVRRLHATFLRVRAIYDDGLLRRHPQQELLRLVLDVSVPPLPDWASVPVSSGEAGR